MAIGLLMELQCVNIFDEGDFEEAKLTEDPALVAATNVNEKKYHPNKVAQVKARAEVRQAKEEQKAEMKRMKEEEKAKAKRVKEEEKAATKRARDEEKAAAKRAKEEEKAAAKRAKEEEKAVAKRMKEGKAVGKHVRVKGKLQPMANSGNLHTEEQQPQMPSIHPQTRPSSPESPDSGVQMNQPHPALSADVDYDRENELSTELHEDPVQPPAEGLSTEEDPEDRLTSVIDIGELAQSPDMSDFIPKDLFDSLIPDTDENSPHCNVRFDKTEYGLLIEVKDHLGDWHQCRLFHAEEQHKYSQLPIFTHWLEESLQSQMMMLRGKPPPLLRPSLPPNFVICQVGTVDYIFILTLAGRWKKTYNPISASQVLPELVMAEDYLVSMELEDNLSADYLQPVADDDEYIDIPEEFMIPNHDSDAFVVNVDPLRPDALTDESGLMNSMDATAVSPSRESLSPPTPVRIPSGLPLPSSPFVSMTGDRTPSPALSPVASHVDSTVVGAEDYKEVMPMTKEELIERFASRFPRVSVNVNLDSPHFNFKSIRVDKGWLVKLKDHRGNWHVSRAFPAEVGETNGDLPMTRGMVRRILQLQLDEFSTTPPHGLRPSLPAHFHVYKTRLGDIVYMKTPRNTWKKTRHFSVPPRHPLSALIECQKYIDWLEDNPEKALQHHNDEYKELPPTRLVSQEKPSDGVVGGTSGRDLSNTSSSSPQGVKRRPSGHLEFTAAKRIRRSDEKEPATRLHQSPPETSRRLERRRGEFLKYPRKGQQCAGAKGKEPVDPLLTRRKTNLQIMHGLKLGR